MLRTDKLSKHYDTPRGPLVVLHEVSLELSPGDGLSIVGPSGSGKSTFLYILGSLETPSSGGVTLGDRDPFAMDEQELATFRNREIGFVFQDHCLLPQLSVLENVLTPTLVAMPRSDRTERAKQLLDRVGLGDRLEHRPAELSGGEKQRVAIARALILEPSLLLCDEPTGNLDRATAEAVADLLIELHAEQRTILVIVTHNEGLAERLSDRRRLTGAHFEPA